jgi:hypothetical protein
VTQYEETVDEAAIERSREYVIICDVDSERAAWLTREQADRAELLLAAEGWTVDIRSPRAGEAEGTYYRKSDGTMQILGYSIEVPPNLDLAIRDVAGQVHREAQS